MAVSCWVKPMAIDGFDGVTAIDSKVVSVVVIVVCPLTPSNEALIIVEPLFTPLTNPELLTMATDVVSELHASIEDVISTEVPSE